MGLALTEASQRVPLRPPTCARRLHAARCCCCLCFCCSGLGWKATCAGMERAPALVTRLCCTGRQMAAASGNPPHGLASPLPSPVCAAWLPAPPRPCRRRPGLPPSWHAAAGTQSRHNEEGVVSRARRGRGTRGSRLGAGEAGGHPCRFQGCRAHPRLLWLPTCANMCAASSCTARSLHGEACMCGRT